jgi:FMN reductase (NADPH)
VSSTIETMLQHRSIRAFKDQPISKQDLDQIIKAGASASSSSLLQVVSIIRVTDKLKRKKLAEYAGHQPYVESAAEFLVFCIDYQRHYAINNSVKPEFTELALIGAIDAGIMAQNCLLAAESLGLGGVYIGGLRNQAEQVDELLGLPQYCAVLFGMCLGRPDQDPQIKPRLFSEIIVHEDSYQPLDLEKIEEYDRVMNEYYHSRSSNNKEQGWSVPTTEKLSKESRPHILGYFHSKGLVKK